MATDDRRLILENLRKAASGGTQKQGRSGPCAGNSLERAEALKVFAAELKALGVPFLVARDEQEADQALTELVRASGMSAAVRWSSQLPELDVVERALEQAGVVFLERAGSERFADVAARADMGVSGADALVAESGALVLGADPGRERSVSLLPPTHLAVVTPNTPIVPGIADLGAWFADQAALSDGPPSGVHLISGPSSTADIELVKVTGVHGPVRLVVLYLEVE